MKFSGYWVTVEQNKATLERTTFDETELDPVTRWEEAWQNQDARASSKGFVKLSSALIYAAKMLALERNQTLSQAQVDLVANFTPSWVDEQFTIHALSQLIENH
jgi:hypothetical protein